MRYLFSFLFFFLTTSGYAQQENTSKQNYLDELKILGKKFTDEYYSNYEKIHTLPVRQFISKIDSVRQNFNSVLLKYKSNLDRNYVKDQEVEIKYYFDKLLIEYPVNHEIYGGKRGSAPLILKELKANLKDFNTTSLLKNADFTNYVKAFLSLQVYLELKKHSSSQEDNKHLNIVWAQIPKLFKEPKCNDFWKSEYLYNHIENNGIKHIEAMYANFKSTNRDTTYLHKVNAIYKEDSIGRQGHLIRPYKNFGSLSLDLHIFLPDSALKGNKGPAIVYFHGGSWSEGKPDWFFYGAENQAKKGWVAIAVEYRTYGRNGTLPFQAVMDAKSAVRWIKEHANEFNIDTSKIIVSGNSAGGHLALATALVEGWNEKTDHLEFSPVPNALMINSGVYDLTDQATAWIRKDLKHKNIVKQISPNHIVKKNFPKTLIIHGTNDKNVPYATAEIFKNEMLKIGNTTIQFEMLKGAGHFIWYDPVLSPMVTKLRNEFISKLGY